MNKLTLLTAILLFSITTPAQEKSDNYFVPSFYSTTGNYSNDNSSISYSGYTLFTVDTSSHVIAGYENLTINLPESDFNHQMFLLGEYLDFFPWLVSGNVAYAAGGYAAKGESFSDTEIMYVFNINVKRNLGLFYLGASYTFSNVKGINTLNVHQTGFTFDYYLGTYFSFQIESYFLHLTDGRNLKSGTITLSFIPISKCQISISKSVGKKAYYFEPFKLTLYNQPDTMRGSFGINTTVSFIKEFDLIFSYNNVGYADYSINYYTAGAKFHIPI